MDCYRPLIHKVVNFDVTIGTKIRFANNFGGGQIQINGSSTSSPYDTKVVAGNTVSLGAIEQGYSSYNQTWSTSGANTSKWKRIDQYGSSSQLSTSQNTSYTIQSNDDNSTIEAGLRKICNIGFNTNTGGGNIKVNGTTYGSSTQSFPIVEQNTITAEAIHYYDNWISYHFENWENGSTNSTITYTATSHETVTANYKGVPLKDPMNLSINSNQPGQRVKLTWTDHPNTGVTQYRIYRGAKVEGNFSNPQIIGTVNRGTTTYTDFSYTIGGSSPNSVAYDVVPFYQPHDSWGGIGMNIVTATLEGPILKSADSVKTETNSLPTEFAISNYPNPFNPSTNISYSIPEASNVKLQIYNMLGQKVVELVNTNMDAGNYMTQWNGKNQNGQMVNSGIYLSVLETKNKRIVQKMILAK